MRYLKTVFSCHFDRGLAKWLVEEKYSFAIDSVNGLLIVFNLSYARMQEIVSTFRIREFYIDNYPNTRSALSVLYKYVDSAIGGNAMVTGEYFRRKYYRQNVMVPCRHELVHRAFFDEEYHDAVEARDHICFDLYGLDACNPTITIDFEEMAVSEDSQTPQTTTLIKNYLILTYKELPDIQANQSCLGAEAWAVDIRNKKIVAVNLPILDVTHVMEKANPVTIHYSEIRPSEVYSNLLEFIEAEIEKIKHKAPFVSDALMLLFTPHLQGIDASQFDD